MFLLVASRLYDPLQGALQNLAAIISTKTNIARMKEILDHDVQTGSEQLTNKGYDIQFASFAAAITSSSVASFLPIRIFSIIVLLKSVTS